MKVLTSVLLSVILTGCAATGPMWSGPASSESGDARIIVYRYSQILAKAGDWVPTRLEVNETTIARIPDGSFVEFHVPAGEIRLSATDMINLHYDNENRMTLHEKIRSEETAYFRIVSVHGQGCGSIFVPVAGGVIAMRTRYPRSDWPVTSCFQRVPEADACKELASLRRAD